MSKLVTLPGVLLIFLSCAINNQKLHAQIENVSKEQTSARFVKRNALISKELPELEIKVSEEFSFVGKFYFEIIANSDEYPPEVQGKPVAAGDRYVFVSANENQKVNKLFIVQFEGFLEENDFIYNYNFDNAEYMGENKYRHNTWFYDSKKLAEENPDNEEAKTREFLKNNGYELEDHSMMSRYVGLASKDRKHEIIIFYIEMLKYTTMYSLEEFENSIGEKEADSIRTSFVHRSKNSFNIIRG